MIAFKTDYARQLCRATIKKAKADGVLASLVDKLRYLATYANRPGCYYDRRNGHNTRCLLFAEHDGDFYFVMQYRQHGDADWTNWFNGGLIRHDKVWGIHT